MVNYRQYVEVSLLFLSLGVFAWHDGFSAALVCLSYCGLYFASSYFKRDSSVEARLKEIENKVQDLYISQIRR